MMNKPVNLTRGLVVFITFLLSIFACNAPQNQGAPTPNIAQMVQQTQTALAVNNILQPSITPAEINLTETIAAEPTIEPVPDATATFIQPPTPTTSSPCIDKAQFVSETIPDNSSFAPNSNFTKSWTLSNIGTCTWETNYSLVWVQGNQLGGASPYPFGQTVAPGQSLEINLPLVTPAFQGDYSSYWKLTNSQNVEFGNLWIKIRVLGAEDPNLGSPTWVETYEDGKSSFGLYSDSNTNFEIKDKNLLITAYSAAGDQWRISSKAYPDDFVLEAVFTTGNHCNNKDSYGLIIRAPNQADSIIDTGYVFVFSCDGKYRVYRMDNGIFTSIQNWSSASSILAGTDKTNAMKIRAITSKFELFANGVLIFEFMDASYSIGFLGLVIRSDTTPNFQVGISKITYWDFSP